MLLFEFKSQDCRYSQTTNLMYFKAKILTDLSRTYDYEGLFG